MSKGPPIASHILQCLDNFISTCIKHRAVRIRMRDNRRGVVQLVMGAVGERAASGISLVWWHNISMNVTQILFQSGFMQSQRYTWEAMEAIYEGKRTS